MAIRLSGKEAITRYRLIQSFAVHAHMEFSLETGRTHQIRVHMQHLGYPLVGDPVYGGHYRRPGGGSEALAQCLRNFKRQALHAKELAFIHPESGEGVNFTADLPDDLSALITQLQDAEAL